MEKVPGYVPELAVDPGRIDLSPTKPHQDIRLPHVRLVTGFHLDDPETLQGQPSVDVVQRSRFVVLSVPGGGPEVDDIEQGQAISLSGTSGFSHRSATRTKACDMESLR